MKQISIILTISLLLVPSTFAERHFEKKLPNRIVEGEAPEKLFAETSSGLNIDAIRKCIVDDRQAGTGSGFCTDLSNYANNAKTLQGTFKKLTDMSIAKDKFESDKLKESDLKKIFGEQKIPFPEIKTSNRKKRKLEIMAILDQQISSIRATLKITEETQKVMRDELRSVGLSDENIQHYPNLEEIIMTPAEKMEYLKQKTDAQTN